MAIKFKGKMTTTMLKYEKNIRDAYLKILQLEKVHKARTYRENDEILKRFEEIIEEAENEI
ncbi:hypothetical protein I3900191A7_10800 [Clostridium baratii]|uniref:hypothetical protein n=1 Tax=Clostridium baratii TaxID=1561 RepID=UPI0030D0BE39